MEAKTDNKTNCLHIGETIESTLKHLSLKNLAIPGRRQHHGVALRRSHISLPSVGLRSQPEINKQRKHVATSHNLRATPETALRINLRAMRASDGFY